MKSKPVILATCPIQTPLGVFAAHYSAAGLARLDFPCSAGSSHRVSSQRLDATLEGYGVGAPHRVPSRGRDAASPAVRRWHKQAGRAVARILRGRVAGEFPPLDLAAGTPFQRKVWAALRQIPAGQTESYGRLAAALGAPKAARAVGSACGANPIPLFIPCHRVVPAGGGLGGFSGGLHWKRRLLALEAGGGGSPRTQRSVGVME